MRRSSRARWKQRNGLTGRVSLQAKLVDGCARFQGTLAARKLRRRIGRGEDHLHPSPAVIFLGRRDVHALAVEHDVRGDDLDSAGSTG